MSKETKKDEDFAKQEDTLLGNSTRRDFIKQGSAGLAGIAGASVLGMQPSHVEALNYLFVSQSGASMPGDPILTLPLSPPGQ